MACRYSNNPAAPLSSASAPKLLPVTYTGSFCPISGQRHGQGELSWCNGDVYIGNFVNGMRQGHGTLVFASSRSGNDEGGEGGGRGDGGEYVGEWQRNLMHGSGTWRYPNGEMYVGEYQQGKRQGEGRFYHANGDLYVGSWHNNQMHGRGRYYFATSGLQFEGTFLRNKRNGKGKLQREDGTVEVFQYVNNERVGQGVKWSADRSKAWRLWIPSHHHSKRNSNGAGHSTAVTYEKKAISIAEAVSLTYDIERSVEGQEQVHLASMVAA